MLDGINDGIEKVSTPQSRVGAAAARVGRMAENGVDLEVIALQMTRNSPNKHPYTATHAEALAWAYEDAKTKSVVTAAQARALIADEKRQDDDLGDMLPGVVV